MSLPAGNKRICFLFLSLVFLLFMVSGLTGCRTEQPPAESPDQAAADEEAWPRGDGSSWFNVMEAGFLSEEPARSEILAGCSQGHHHLQDCLSADPVSHGKLEFRSACRAGSYRKETNSATTKPLIVQGLMMSTGIGRLLEVEGHASGDRHIALKDRFWIEVGEGASDQGLSRKPGWRGFSRKKGGGIGRPGSDPCVPSQAHFWVFY